MPATSDPKPIHQKVGQQMVKHRSTTPTPIETCQASSNAHAHGLGQSRDQAAAASPARTPKPAAIHASTDAAGGGKQIANASATMPRIAAIVIVTRRPKHQPPSPPPPLPPLPPPPPPVPVHCGTVTSVPPVISQAPQVTATEAEKVPGVLYMWLVVAVVVTAVVPSPKFQW